MTDDKLFAEVAKNKTARMNMRMTTTEQAWIKNIAKESDCSVSDIMREALRVYSERMEDSKYV